MKNVRTHVGGELERLYLLGAVGGLSDPQLLEEVVAGDDEGSAAAFEAIVKRHGPMVLRVCRMVLRDLHAAEDAFQATFLILARKARTLGERELLGNWLYGVAVRTARKARTTAARRLVRDQEAAHQRSVTIPARPPEEGPDEIGRVLHEEIERLPGPYRAAVVVCYLEGMTQAQAAQQLRLAESTVRGRLSRARRLLARRLTRRGVAPSTGLLALSALVDAVAARLSDATVRTVARAALLFMRSSKTTCRAVSTAAYSIANGVLSTMCFHSIKTLGAVLVAVGLIGAGDALLSQPAAEAQLQDARLQIEPPPQVVADAIAPTAASGPASETSPAVAPAPAPLLPEDPDASQPRSKRETERQASPPLSVDADSDLVKHAPGPIVRAVPVSKDCMVLAYLPEWNFGNVDNIGIGNNDGGVRTLIDWPEIARDEADSPDRRFLIALYSRKTISHPPAGSIQAFEILEEWPERTSWRTKPRYDPEPTATFEFEPGGGWKLFDVTRLVRARAKAGSKAHGLLFRFESEDMTSAPKETFSDYKLVSREGDGEWANRRPLLLIVKAAKPAETPAR